ncbi:hypothetical protein [Maledivibacter halophilus]|uniref:Ethanolamine utilization protein n=1 Tax=Maledivibacter halophilus TaxID=36842 RepID=A0A1T5MKX0_9FIRM|nr:hypothetical protein [Maledivibacter halophilus]SKC88509.1 hypothetical protein SAMN02194393_04897 [Maledivibacter halophilus]
MDEKKFDELVKRVIARVQQELQHKQQNKSILPNAYLILPDNWNNQDLVKKILEQLDKEYQITIAVSSMPETIPSEWIGYSVELQERIDFPNIDFTTIIPVETPSLIAKVALCIEDDFVSRWVAKSLRYGQSVCMQLTPSFFTGKELFAYRQKIESYIKEVKAFGICFEMDTLCKMKNKKESSSALLNKKKQVITLKDIEKLASSKEEAVFEKELCLKQGDILTLLAKERAAELGINIVWC